MLCPHCSTEVKHGISKCPFCTGDIAYSSIASTKTMFTIGKYCAIGGAIFLPYFLHSAGFVDSMTGYLGSAAIGGVLGFGLPWSLDTAIKK